MVVHGVFIHSFKAYRISSSTDSFIHYLKPGGVAHKAVEAITTETLHLNSSDSEDGDDPFARDSEAEFEAVDEA